MSRRWWEETGGYDTKMVAWGGENIDQSLRSWLCGGRIEVADGAFVAHMWRDPKNPKTAAMAGTNVCQESVGFLRSFPSEDEVFFAIVVPLNISDELKEYEILSSS